MFDNFTIKQNVILIILFFICIVTIANDILLVSFITLGLMVICIASFSKRKTIDGDNEKILENKN